MSVQHIVFDLMGTLTTRNETVATQRILRFRETYRHQWDVEDRPIEEYIADFAEKERADPSELLKEWLAFDGSKKFYEGIVEILRELHAQGFKLHILSDTGKFILDFVEKENEVFDLFTSMTFSYHLRCAKPDFRVFRAVFRKTGAKPHECLMVGNSIEHDINPAEMLGMRTLHFTGRKDDPQKILDAARQ